MEDQTFGNEMFARGSSVVALTVALLGRVARGELTVTSPSELWTVIAGRYGTDS